MSSGVNVQVGASWRQLFASAHGMHYAVMHDSFSYAKPMLATVREMEEARDREALGDLWRLLGGSSALPRGPEGGRFVQDLIHELCGKGDRYAAERSVLAELAKTVDVNPNEHPDVVGLEDRILEELGRRLQAKLDAMSVDERRRFFEDMVKRMSDEDRIRLIEQILEGYESMSEPERAQFRRRLAAELEVEEDEIAVGIAGGAGTLLPLMLAKQSGFAVFLWTTNIMAATASSVGLTIPFAAYMLKNRALGWLLGPVGMLVTTAMSAGWFAVKAWRRKERFRKLIQVVAYCSSWRDERTLPSGPA